MKIIRCLPFAVLLEELIKKDSYMKLTWQQGFIDKSLIDVLNLQLKPVPQIVWLEPRPIFTKTTDLKAPIDFQGLQVLSDDNKDWIQDVLSQGVVADELCLYWKNSFCHLLTTSDNKACRWFFCQESDNTDYFFDDNCQTGYTIVKKVEESRQSVITRQDCERFALNSYLGEASHFKVVTYWENSALFAWRLYKDNQNV